MLSVFISPITANAAIGDTWRELTTAGTKNWQGITSSVDGRKLAAVVARQTPPDVEVSTLGYIYTSADAGATWTEQTSAGSRNWSSIASSSDGTKIVASVDNGFIYRSTDSGATWSQTGAPSGTWKSVASNSDGTILAAGRINGFIHTSIDSGSSWQTSLVSFPTLWSAIAISSDGSKFAGANSAGVFAVNTVDRFTYAEPFNDLVTWTSVAMSGDGSKMVAAEIGGTLPGEATGGFIYTSTDFGVTWTKNTSAGNRLWSSVTSSTDGNNLAAAVDGGKIYQSSDSGITWTATGSISAAWNAMASNGDGRSIAAAIRDGSIYVSISVREVACGTGTYTITDGVASAGSDCTGSLVFENDVTEIAREGFRNSAITSLTLPPNLQTIRYAAFYETSQYPTLVIPNSVTLIENQAFEQGQFTSLTLGNSLTSIGDQVFYRNYGIRINSITFGTGLTSIGYAAFQNFGVDRLTIPEGVTTIAGRAFDAISSSVLVLPNSLTTLASDSFVGGNFSIVKYCGSNAAVIAYTFNVSKTCGAIVDFDRNLGSGSMSPQTSSTNTTLSSSTFTRSGYVFQGWNTQSNGLGTTYLSSDSFPFSTSPNRTLFAKWLQICDGSSPCSLGDTGPGGGVIFYVAPSLFDCGPTLSEKCKYLEYARITGTNPWSRVSAAWSGVTSTAITTTSAAIGTGYKNTLAMVNQPSGGNTSGKAGTLTRAYRGPNNLSDWYLPSIDELDALRLYDVNHTNELNQVDNFEYWSSTEVDYRSANFSVFLSGGVDVGLKSGNIAIQAIRAFGSSNFTNCGTSGTFTIANNIVTGNTNCLGSVAIPTGVTSIAEDAFTANTSITSVDIPSTVHTIGMAAFYANTSLATVTFQANSQLTSIGSAAFERTAIASITLPNSLTYLGNYAFYGNTALTSITIPEGVTQILQNTFESATALTSINLPTTLTSIEGEVFKGTALTSITIPNGVTSIGTNAFANTTALTTYTYCGAISNADLTAAGLGGKTKESCSAPVVYVAPTPVPYLKTLTTPKLNLKDGKLICTPGTYNAGYTLDGIVQGSTALFTPSSFIYNLLVNGIVQTTLTVTSSITSNSWNMPEPTSGSLITCAVTVAANGVTKTDKSTENTGAVSSALSAQTTATSAAEAAYVAAKSANSKAYQKALVDNRAQWRKEITAIRANYYEVLARINAAGSSRKMISDKSTALKIMISAQRKSAADYKASHPTALAAKDAADKAALDTKTSAIAKANATYGTFIESIGYGVLIP